MSMVQCMQVSQLVGV